MLHTLRIGLGLVLAATMALGCAAMTGKTAGQTIDDATITVIDQDNAHVYQPGLLFVPFGLADPDDIVRPRGRQLHDGIRYRCEGIYEVDPVGQEVRLEDGTVVPYDVLIVATGTRLLPEEGFSFDLGRLEIPAGTTLAVIVNPNNPNNPNGGASTWPRCPGCCAVTRTATR